MKCIECKLSGVDYGLPDKNGWLWTMDEMEVIDNEDFFNHFTDEVYDKMDWQEIKYNKRNGKVYCERCENKLFADEMRIERIVAARRKHEETTGQLQMFPNLTGGNK